MQEFKIITIMPERRGVAQKRHHAGRHGTRDVPSKKYRLCWNAKKHGVGYKSEML